MNLIGTNVHTDMVGVPLEVNDGIFEPVDAFVEWGVSSMVVMQRGPQAIHHVKESPEPLRERVFGLI